MNSDANADDAMAFAARLKVAIGSASARSVALKAGVSPTVMNQYLSGKSEPTRRMINAIANTTGVSLDWLMTGNGPMRPSDPAAPAPAPENDARLIGRLTEKILLLYKEMGVRIAVHQAAERAVRESHRIVAAIPDPDDRLIEIGEVIATLRQELREAAANPETSKHRA